MTNKQIAELIEWYSNNDENELTSEEKTELIRKTKSNKFIKRCIKELGIGLSNKDRITLLKVLDDKRFTDECIMNDEYGFSGLDKVELIVSIMGDSYIDKLARLAIKGSKIDETVMNFFVPLCIKYSTASAESALERCPKFPITRSFRKYGYDPERSIATS